MKIYCTPDSAWGTAFLLTMALGVGGYVGGGVVLGGRAKGQPSSLRVHPHYSKWLEGVALVGDGLSFTRARLQGRGASKMGGRGGRGGGGRERLHAAAGEDESRGTTRKEKSKKKEQHDAPSKQPKAKKGRGDAAYAGVAVAAVASPITAATPVAAAGTLAGDGGRWVHVAN